MDDPFKLPDRARNLTKEELWCERQWEIIRLEDQCSRLRRYLFMIGVAIVGLGLIYAVKSATLGF